MGILVGASAASASAPEPSGSSSSGSAPAQQPTSSSSGGTGFAPAPAPPSTPIHPIVPGFAAKVISGLAYAPADAPTAVQRAIWAGDRIRQKPYVYGGGHGTWNAAGYDCSGSVSYVLHAAALLHTSMDSTDFMTWGQAGVGRWITVYTSAGHAFVEIAGIRFDTSAEGDPHPAPGSGPRWRRVMATTAGFMTRHPADL
jgi:hypothetical protein